MNNELYTAASGMLVEKRRLELISNNLANISTNGYRSQRLFAAEFKRVEGRLTMEARDSGASVAVAGTYDVPGPGPLRPTGRDLDVALGDDAHLTVETAAGPRYTRAGNLQVSPEGELTDAQGHRILDPKGKPIVGAGTDTSIAPDGRVLSGETELGRMALVRDPGKVLTREGNNLLTAGGRDAALEKVEGDVLQPGWLEGSGTNALGELVLLIEAQRAFETYQKLISMTMNEVNRKAVNDLAG